MAERSPQVPQEDGRRWQLANVDGGRLVVSGNTMLALGERVEVVPASVVAALRDENEWLRRDRCHYRTQAAMLHEANEVARLTARVEERRDGLDEGRAVAGLALTFIPADRHEAFAERCRAMLAAVLSEEEI